MFVMVVVKDSNVLENNLKSEHCVCKLDLGTVILINLHYCGFKWKLRLPYSTC